jgi:poly(A) polymerase
MALELTTAKPEFIDPFAGMADLQKKILRTPTSA